MKIFSKLLKKLKSEEPKRRYWSGWNTNDSGLIGIYEVDLLESSSTKQKKDKRIEKKPVEIYKEIILEEPKMNLEDLDGQIALVERRKEVLSDYLEDYVIRQEDVVIEFLKARKKYDETKDNFKWALTTQKLIDDLCKKYKVRCVNFEPFYRNVPMEAVDEIEKFGEAWKTVRKDEPFLKLIIDYGKEEKKDPILLAGSPFGNWFYILGAWDKEVEIVDDLIYNGK